MYPLMVAEITIATIIMETSVSIRVMPVCREVADDPIIFMSISEHQATGGLSF
jgi:hypothetical protein